MRKHSLIIFFLCIIAVIRAQTTPDSLTLSPGDTVTVLATETIKKTLLHQFIDSIIRTGGNRIRWLVKGTGCVAENIHEIGF